MDNKIGKIFHLACLRIFCRDFSVGLLAAGFLTLNGSSLTADEVGQLNEEGVIEITGNDQMKFDVSSFEVKAGQEVTIILKNIGKLPKVAMAHNIVIIKQGTDAMKFAMAGISSKDTDYVPPAMKESVVAMTDLAGPGESVKVTFTAPSEPGDYAYICTFPGHFMAGMKGLMVVKDS